MKKKKQSILRKNIEQNFYDGCFKSNCKISVTLEQMLELCQNSKHVRILSPIPPPPCPIYLNFIQIAYGIEIWHIKK